MRIAILILTFFVFAPLAMAADNGAPVSSGHMNMPTEQIHPPLTAQQPESGQSYICPMHPQVRGKKGDKCPICKMDLVPQEKSSPMAGMPMEEEKAAPETPAPEAAQQPDAEQVYICPMHPHIHGKKGGTCPICGMDLVPQEQSSPMDNTPMEGEKTAPAGDQSGALRITPDYIQALGVRTDKVSSHTLGRSIHAFGIIEPSTRSEYVVAIRKNGWITDLKTSAMGDTVKKGDLLFTLYSPDLMAAQSDYLLNRSGIGDPERRLYLYGMDDKSIALLREKGRMLEETPFYAPMDGTVLALNVRKGSFVDVEENSETVLTLQDLSKVWANAHVPVRDLQFLAVGTPASVTVESTGETYSASVDFIYPDVDAENRKGMARLVVDNPDGKLKLNTPVSVTFTTDSASRLAVPEEAVLYDQAGAHVIMAMGHGRFHPVNVKTGITANGLTEITSGLSEGQDIVTSGQFMIDAESNLRGGMNNMTGMDMESDHAQ